MKKIIRYPIPKRMNNPITTLEKKKQSKYRNKKVLVDGIKFDSKKEARRYSELMLLEKTGEITDLKLQQRYILQESFKIDGKTIRAITYIADFTYKDKNGDLVVEDEKGMKTQVYNIKRKMFAKRYGIEIKEVY